MRKKVIHRNHNIIENVDFDRLNKILEWEGIAKPELSRRCGYYDGYITKHVFGEKRLNQTVANTLEKVYGVSPSEYTYKETDGSTSNDKEEYGFYDAFLTALKFASFTDNELKERKYTLHVQVDGLQLKKMILEAVGNENNFLIDCIFKGEKNE